jgi:arginyl-tRNA synthetase
VKKYESEYERLNVRFDVYTGESLVGKESMADSLERLESMGLISDADGAKLVDLEKWKLGKTVVRKKGEHSFSSSPCRLDLTSIPIDGTSIYLTRDIGGAVERYEKYKFDKMIYVVSSQQDQYMSQFLKVLELLGLPWAKSVIHINYGLVQGMSTRKGTVVFLDQIIKEAGQVMHDQMQKNPEKYAAVEDPANTALEIGITGVKIQDMAARRSAAVFLLYSFFS